MLKLLLSKLGCLTPAPLEMYLLDVIDLPCVKPGSKRGGSMKEVCCKACMCGMKAGDTAPETEHEVQSGLLLDVVVSQSAAIF